MRKDQSESSSLLTFLNRKTAPLFFLALLPLFFSMGFRPAISDTKLSEGIIEFTASPVDTSLKSSMIIPDKMIMKFKNNYSSTEEEAGLGFAKMKFIADPVKKEFLTAIFFFEKKQSVLDTNGIRQTNYYLPEYEVEYGDKTKEISGYKCKNAILKFKNGDPSYEVWFTKEIGIENPNWANAYYKIDGVLLDYRLKKYGLDLHFIANTVYPAKIDDSNFTIPAEYEMTANSDLEKMFEGFYTGK
ncbi:MAG TPA: hypothetical protein VFJ43_17060 [Bacteroidia bacterium]|nr:hypothetical protein [Bacteroidia bacterium]